ncbi:MAG: 23S rRNA (guanosine(2251)-2'-O)-methyltransferase RlmB, partial [Rubrobacteridae bacterium]|nr:23S rRNA (guanosine(2251)-2'-O)-methyltransferase RlmB [Rubrobacteridae bacterium]
IADIEALAKKQGILVSRVDRRDLDEFTGSRVHQGVIAILKEPQEFLSFADFAAELDMDSNPIVLILDEVTDPQNFGALIRSADAAGIDGIIISKRRSAPMSAAVHKASAGASLHMKIVHVSNLVYTIEDLKEMGFWVTGASEKAKQQYYEIDFTGPMVIVLGSEGKGISRLLREKCDFLAAIPMYGKVSSLNVSVAGAILMFEAVRQRAIEKKS